MDGFITAKEAADIIGVKHGSVLAAIRRTQAGKAKYPLNAVKFGRDWLVKETDAKVYGDTQRKRGRKSALQRKAGRAQK